MRKVGKDAELLHLHYGVLDTLGVITIYYYGFSPSVQLRDFSFAVD